MSDLNDQLMEKSRQLEELQVQFNKREADLQKALNRSVQLVLVSRSRNLVWERAK